jgi:hypothetical protein
MDTQLIARYTELTAAKDDIRLKHAAAQARLEDSEKAMGETVGEIKELGFQSVAELQAAIVLHESELKVLIEEAEKKLRVGGYS